MLALNLCGFYTDDHVVVVVLINVIGADYRHNLHLTAHCLSTLQGPKKWFASKEGPRQEQAIFSGSVHEVV